MSTSNYRMDAKTAYNVSGMWMNVCNNMAASQQKTQQQMIDNQRRMDATARQNRIQSQQLHNHIVAERNKINYKL